MRKSFFLQLILVVMCSAVLVPYFTTPAVSRLVLTPGQEALHRYHLIASMEVLAEYLSSYEPPLQSAMLRDLQVEFPYRIELVDINALEFKDEQLERLNEGKTVHLTTTHDTAKLLQNSNRLLVIRDPDRATPDKLSDAQREVMGTAALLIKSLQDQPQHEWASIIENKSAYFHYPVSLRQLDSIRLDESERRTLTDGHVLTRLSKAPVKYGSGVDYFYQLVANSDQVVSAGPISPFIDEQIVRYRKHNLWLVAAVMLLVLALWLYPGWRSSVALSDAAKRFGKGDLACRGRQFIASNLNKMTRNFNQMAAKTQQLFADNKTITLALSNELRNPISQIDMAILSIDEAVSSDDQKTAADSIRREIGKLNQLTSDLTYYAKIQGQPLQLAFECRQIGCWLEQQIAVFSKSFLRAAPQIRVQSTLSSQDKVRIDERYVDPAMQGLLLHLAASADVKIGINALRQGNSFQIRLSGVTASDDPVGLLSGMEANCSRDGEHEKHHPEGTAVDQLPYLIASKIFEIHNGRLEVSEYELHGKTLLTITLPVESRRGGYGSE